jgi:dTDP-4-amino-4,6-dideoxygalactose transaminase
MIPFNKPLITGRELSYIAQAVESGQLAGDGSFTKRCHAWLEETFNGTCALLTHSCTSALEMAGILSGIGPGDEVVLPSYTFVSTANAFALRGATLRFVDIRDDTFNLDERLLEAAVTPRTKVIVPVHYGGVACAMDEITAIARHHGCLVVEDAAHAVHARYHGRWLGTLGDLGCYSFHETKNFISGEGGALMVNDARFIERAEIIREKGTDRSNFHRGVVDKYSWVDIGSSYLPSEIIAAFLLAQLEEAERITAKRVALHQRYLQGFAAVIASGRVHTQHVPFGCEHNGHLFCLLIRDAGERARLITHLRDHGILAVFHYVPLHTSPMGQRLGGSQGQLPVTEVVAERLVRLPLYHGLTHTHQDQVIDLVLRFLADESGRP